MKPKSTSEKITTHVVPARKKTFMLAVLFIVFYSLPIFNLLADTYRTRSNTSGNWIHNNTWEVYDLGQAKYVNTQVLPSGSDDVFITRTVDIPQDETVNLKSLVINSTGVNITLLLRSGAAVTVLGNVTVNSPSAINKVNTIELKRATLDIKGYLNLGNNNTQSAVNNNVGDVLVTLNTGTAELFSTLKVAESISNNSLAQSTSICTLNVENYDVVEVGRSLNFGSKMIGLFDANTTVKFKRSTAQSTSTQLLPTNAIFGNLVISNLAGISLTGAISTNNVKGDVIIESGFLDDNGFPISGTGSNKLTVKDGAKLVLNYSNPSTNPNFNSLAFPDNFNIVELAPTSTVVYNAGINSLQKVSALSTPYGNLEFRGGSSSQKKLLGDIQANNVLVEAKLYLDLGAINIGNNTLTLKTDGSLNNFDKNHYVKVGSAGKMLVENMGPNLGNRSGVVAFPIGSASSYTPAFITSTNTLTNFSVGVNTGVRALYTSGPYYNYHVVNRTWDITSSIPSAEATITLQWNKTDETSNFDRTKCFITHYKTTTGAWENTNDISQSAQLVSANVYSATITGQKNFSPFSVGDGGNPLPVELVFFKAAKQDNGVALNWETASEKNNKGYDVQVSTDGKHFEFVSFVASKNGNANYSQRYEFLDKTSRSGLVYYRLKQTDFDGTVAYYAAKVVDMGKFTESVSAYPNPFRDQFEIKLQAAAAQDVLLQITDMAGKTVYRNAPKVIAGQNVIPVTLENNLPAGLYILTAKTATQVYTTRIVKQ